MPQKSREDRNVEAIWNATSAYFRSEERIQRAVDHITDALAKCHPQNPEADALRIALGILLGATAEATT
jgi:hypothetical protein